MHPRRLSRIAPRRGSRLPPSRPGSGQAIAVAALVALSLLGACRSVPGITTSSARHGPLIPASVPASDAPSSAERLDARLERLFEKARALVESDGGVDLSDVRLRLVDDEIIFAEVRDETRRLVESQIGEAPLAARLLRALVDGQSGTYAALYSGGRRSVLVSRKVLSRYLAGLPAGAGRADDALLVLMLHELTHAADDTRHAIHASRVLDFRASFAQSAAFEGHAQWRTRVLCRRHGCLEGLDSLDAFMFGDRPRRGDAEQNLLEYSYIEGERFVTALAARPDGQSAIERLLSSPPQDPLQILDPASFPNKAREARNRRLLAASRGVSHPWLDAGTERRVAITTSPLKGVNLRDDPHRRAAAIDGFIRLVTAMVSVQFHDPAASVISPVEVTLMQTDSASTAQLFADTLHAHALSGRARTGSRDGAEGSPGARADAEEASGDEVPLRRTATELEDGGVWRTAIAARGQFVVQASGRHVEAATMDAYVLGALGVLSESRSLELSPIAESTLSAR